MPHVVTQSCCSDASCTYACPVNCIQPTPDDPDFLAAEMLHVDPATCVDCGACVTACPVEAIKPHTALTEAEQPYLDINRLYHEGRARAGAKRDLLARPVPRLHVKRRPEPLRVAVIGSGPSGLYAADEVLTIPGAEATIYERLAEPYGLARFGVAPDHRRTRRISGQFEQIRSAKGLKFKLGVEVGRDVTQAELLDEYDAVIYAVGAAADRKLAIPGAELPGVTSATDFVAWYNGHPEFRDMEFDLSAERAVVIGNGNVGLDVARILTTDPERLAQTDISERALAALRASNLNEVVITGRRGPREASFTLPEILGLASAPGVELVVDPAVSAEIPGSKLEWLSRLSAASRAGTRKIHLRFYVSPARVHGTERVTDVEFAKTRSQTESGYAGTGTLATNEHTRIDAGLVLTSIGYGAEPVADLPFDDTTRTVPNHQGRVVDPVTGDPQPGTYVTGWIKRGPSGFLGTNRSDSQETVRALVEDFNAGRLDRNHAGSHA
ncbi:MAG: FAD-dependent oxidoreductase [Solirubrobacterales bacterium]|nr:FAD-dependent oxidoreductase [Solirubrobacterales bacterium]